MKENIHPKYKEIKVTCSCGNTFITSSTLEREELHLDVCASCHPFYTGKQKVVDTAGRVDRFKQKYVQKTPVERPKKEEIVIPQATKKKKAPAKKVVSITKSTSKTAVKEEA